jgi:hypothetical protein
MAYKAGGGIMPEGVNAKVEALFAQSLSAFAVGHLRITSLQGEGS